ncbi:MAG: hypothetical protein LBN10_01465 [Propionibacteriaceae bacterium]|jgi:hypothetical protein|nr:hypothetical protein [Propionibacteriaceae bacterium]
MRKDSKDSELLELVKTLQGEVHDLKRQVKSLKLVDAPDVSEDVLVAIAAGVAAYIGYAGERRQPRFEPVSSWNRATKISRLNHTPTISR